MRLKTLPLSLYLSITLSAHAGVIDNPSAAASRSPSAVPVVNSGLPANPLSLPLKNLSPLPLPSPSISPSLKPLPEALIPTHAAAVAAATPSLPDIPQPFDQARSLNTFWDGLQVPSLDLEDPSFSVVPLSVPADEPPDAGRLAPWLETPSPKIAAALDRAVALARTTRTGRRALDAAEKTLFSEGRSLPILVLDLGRNHGEYDYLAKNMRLHSALFKKGREAELAGTIVHELTHVAQHGAGVPSNALEMELEAHLQDLEMLAELGVKPRQGTFARQALDLLAQGPAKFIQLIQAAIPGAIFLGESSLEDVLDQLEDDLSEQIRRSKRSRVAAALVPVIESDLARLRSPEGAASYRAFSRRVLALLKRRAAEAR